MENKEFKKRCNELKSEFHIGKQGVTETLISSVDKYLDAHRIVKIKSLTAKDKNEIKDQANEIIQSLEVKLLEQKGFTFVLFKD